MSLCLLVSPEVRGLSFWLYPATWNLRGVRYAAAPLGLLTVAALLPAHWQIRLVDCNVVTLHDHDLQWADVVFIGGMITQQRNHLELIDRCRRLGKTVVSGGPDPTNSPHIYKSAHHLVLDEAESSLGPFLADWERGDAQKVYRADKRPDMESSPPPRWDLLNIDDYLYPSLQWSRGCPFNCEFCDIIELYGRIPRHKTVSQVLSELQALYNHGHRGHVEFVDDNLIGNQKTLVPLLAEVAAWQKARGYPFEFSCEASLNLADRPALLEGMRAAGFIGAFIGIETPDSGTLKTAQKHQNTRRNIVDSIKRLYGYGIHAYAGYIVGMDGEPAEIAREMVACIQDSAVPVNMVGLLFALPTTQLATRLAREGRLEEGFEIWPSDEAGDQCLGGLNFATQRPRAQVLRDYREVVLSIYDPPAFFKRVAGLAQLLDMRGHHLKFSWSRNLQEARTFARMVWKMGIQSRWRAQWWSLLAKVALGNPRAFRYVIWSSAFYLHFEEFTARLIPLLDRRIAQEERSTVTSLQS